MGEFVQGMSAMACIVIALFFVRYWQTTQDRFFLIFAIAFCLMCITRLVSAALGVAQTHTAYVYTLRFLAYLLIVVAIVDKNRPRGAVERSVEG